MLCTCCAHVVHVVGPPALASVLYKYCLLCLVLCLTTCIYMYMYMYMMWGELASHKRTLTHHPSSQGCGHPGVPCHICLFVWAMVGWVTLPFFSFCFLQPSVPCTCVSMYIHVHVYCDILNSIIIVIHDTQYKAWIMHVVVYIL